MRLVFILAVFGLFCISEGTAQVSMSPRGTVTQIIDGTTITVNYARPRLRDRANLFGGQIFWGHIWTPGADDATTIEFDKEIKIEYVSVPAGKYSMWMVNNKEDWEVILDPKWDQFHLPEPKRPENGYFFWVTPDTMATPKETLTFDFSRLENFGADLQMHFDTRLVTMNIKVPPSIQLIVTEEEVKPYLSNFKATLLVTEWNKEPFDFDMTFEYDEGKLSAPIKWNKNGEGQPTRFLMKTDQILYMGFFEGDELLSTGDTFFEFLLDEEGQAISFEWRSPEDELMMRGVRSN